MTVSPMATVALVDPHELLELDGVEGRPAEQQRQHRVPGGAATVEAAALPVEGGGDEHDHAGERDARRHEARLAGQQGLAVGRRAIQTPLSVLCMENH